MTQRQPTLVIQPVKHVNFLSGHKPVQGQSSSVYCVSTFQSATPASQRMGAKYELLMVTYSDYSDNNDNDSDADEY